MAMFNSFLYVYQRVTNHFQNGDLKRWDSTGSTQQTSFGNLSGEIASCKRFWNEKQKALSRKNTVPSGYLT